jgi:hypothetical protein
MIDDLSMASESTLDWIKFNIQQFDFRSYTLHGSVIVGRIIEGKVSNIALQFVFLGYCPK